MGVEVFTEPVSADAVSMPPSGGALRPNRALAELLVATHRAVFTLDVRPSGPVRKPTPEEQLLRAIFGEKAEQHTHGTIPDIGTELTRGAVVIEHPQGSLRFTHASKGIVENVASVTDDLPEGIAARTIVTVGWSDPLQVGDELVANGASLGRIDGFVDDGDT
jgi:hypothetical protein